MAQQTQSLPLSVQSNRPKKRKQSPLGRDWKLAYLFIAPIVILILLFIAWPFVRAIYTSMTVRTLQRVTKFVWFDNYITLYQDDFYWQAVRNTIVFTAGSITTKFIFGLCAALLLHAQQRYRNILTGLVLLPWIVPSVVQALAWRSIYDPLFGGLNPILMGLGIIDKPWEWLADPKLAMWSVIFVNVWAGIPFFIVNFLAGLGSIDKELYEAAEIDGANSWERFVNITLPGMKYVIAVTTLLSTIWTFNGFETIYLLTGGNAGTEVYSILAYKKAMGALRFGPGTAVAFSLTPVLVFFILLLSRYMRRDATREQEVPTWQDHLIDGLGSVLGSVFWVLTLPFALLTRLFEAFKPQNSYSVGSKQRNALLSGILRTIALLVLLVYVLFPFYWIMITAFKSDGQIGQRAGIFWPDPWTVEQFTKLFQDIPFPLWFQNSVIVSISTTLLAVLFSSLGGYALALLQFRGSQALTSVLLVTYLLPGALMFIPMYGILADLGIVNTRLALIVTYPTFMMPFATWLLMGYYRSIPEELEQAAMVDGANRWQAFTKIILPLTKPAILAVTLFSFTAAWKEFLFAFVFISSDKLLTLPVGLAQTIFGDIYPWGLLMAASLIISVPVVIFYIYGQKYMVAGLTAGSVKG